MDNCEICSIKLISISINAWIIFIFMINSFKIENCDNYYLNGNM